MPLIRLALSAKLSKGRRPAPNRVGGADEPMNGHGGEQGARGGLGSDARTPNDSDAAVDDGQLSPETNADAASPAPLPAGKVARRLREGVRALHKIESAL